MKKAIWFSRHVPTVAQIEDAAKMGFELIPSPHITAAARTELVTSLDVAKAVDSLKLEVLGSKAAAVFGVFAAPVQGELVETAERTATGDGVSSVPCYASWNIQRPEEGGKPTFQHRGWIYVGRI